MHNHIIVLSNLRTEISCQLWFNWLPLRAVMFPWLGDDNLNHLMAIYASMFKTL